MFSFKPKGFTMKASCALIRIVKNHLKIILKKKKQQFLHNPNNPKNHLMYILMKIQMIL